MGVDRALSAQRRHGVVQGRRAAGQGQRRMDVAATACRARTWCRAANDCGARGCNQPLQVTPDSGGLWMQFYECEAYYWVAVANFAEALATIDPAEGARLAGRGRSVSQRPADGRRTNDRPFAGRAGPRRHLPLGHSIRLLRAGPGHWRLGVETGWFWKSRGADVLGNCPVGGGADEPGGTPAARGCAGPGLSRRTGGPLACRESSM